MGKLIMGEWIVETPYKEIDEEGFELHKSRYSIVVRDVEDRYWTHHHVFVYRAMADKFLDRIKGSTRFNPEYWSEGAAWDDYIEPLSYEEAYGWEDVESSCIFPHIVLALSQLN